MIHLIQKTLEILSNPRNLTVRIDTVAANNGGYSADNNITALFANVCYYNPTHCKRDFDSGGGLQTSCMALPSADGGSVKPLGDLTHPAEAGFILHLTARR